MTSMTITSITLQREWVEAILTDHLNKHTFRQPLVVTGSEYIDGCVILTLEPAPEPSFSDIIEATTYTYPERVVTMTPPLVEYRTATPPTNGNGHHDPVGADLRVGPSPATSQPAPIEEDAPQPAAEPRKRHVYTPEEDAKILHLEAEGYSIDKIAAELGLTRSGVNYRITRARKADGVA